MTLRARFVDSISATPTVRLDLAAAPWRLQRSSRFDPPAAKRARASTLLSDGSVYPASAYEDRVLELHLLMENASTDDAAAAIQVLARELDRPVGNIFEYRLPDQTHSVFFRTVRLAMDAVDIVTEGRDQFVSAPVIAEPFAYGLREDPIVDAVVSADPAAPSNGCFVDVSGVKGDVETPALIRWPVGGTNQDRQTLFAVRRRGTPANVPFLFQAEVMTQGTDTTTQPNDANMSGAGNNYSRCDFATDASMVTRLSVTSVGTAGVDLRGKYRVFCRYRKNTALDDIRLRLQFGDGIVFVTNDEVTPANSTEIRFADLGEMSIPVGADPVSGRDGVELSVSNDLDLRVQAERVSGTGTLDLDFLLLVPSDDRTGIVEWSLFATGEHWVLDAEGTAAYHRDSSDRMHSAAAPKISGGFPLLSPNQTNRIYVLYQVSGDFLHFIGHTDDVSVSYFPRYLSVRPAST